jgi:predicted transposase YdaD
MQFDATLKTLLEAGPADWPRLLGVPASRVELIDADTSTVSGAADKVLRIVGPPHSILHLEFQVGPDADKPRKLNVYNSILEDRTGLPVRTVLILLRPEAFLRVYSGRYERSLPGTTSPYRYFGYDVLKIWKLSPKHLLGGIGTLPLAPIAAVAEEELPNVLGEMAKRLERGVSPSLRNQIWTSAFVLMGLRYQKGISKALFERVLAMKESVTYQAIVEEGRIEEARKLLLQLGTDRFQLSPSKNVQAELSSIFELRKLERLARRVLKVETWEQLLNLPEPKR